MRIQIRLLTLMRIWIRILLLVKAMRICSYWHTVLIHDSIVSLHASIVSLYGFRVSLMFYFKPLQLLNSDLMRILTLLLTLMQIWLFILIRIRLPKLCGS